MAAENYVEVAVLRYSLCVVARVVAQELAGDGPSALSLQRRRELFDLTSAWAEEGTAGGAQPHCSLYVTESCP